MGNQGRSVLLLDVDSRKERKNVMTRLRQLFRTLPRNSVHWNHRGPANMSPNWFPSWSLRRTVWMYLRKSVLDPGPILGRSRNLWSRNGVMFLLRNLAWLNSTTDIMDTWTYLNYDQRHSQHII